MGQPTSQNILHSVGVHTVTIRLGGGVAVLAPLLLLAGATTSMQAASAVAGPCGALVWWKLPERLEVSGSGSRSSTAQTLATHAIVDVIIRAAETFCRQHDGQYPRTFQEMFSVFPPESECVLEPTHVMDGWGHPVFYGLIAGSPIVRSAGADGVFTTADDIGWPTVSDMNVESFEIPGDCPGS